MAAHPDAVGPAGRPRVTRLFGLAELSQGGGVTVPRLLELLELLALLALCRHLLLQPPPPAPRPAA
jgi:hypothetical protein